MRRNNQAFVISDFGSIVFNAENKIPDVRPGGRKVDPHKAIYWDEAPQELKDDPKTMWCETKDNLLFGVRRFTFIKPTEDDKKEMFLNKQWKLKEVFYYILKNHSLDDALRYKECEDYKFKKYKVEVNTNWEHCIYNKKDSQCSLFCPFYSGGKCTSTRLKEEN